ncbi:MAG: pyroglutamyl peptidase [Actinophytocola sp.]|uniref:pyroglutamyl peptidase n=1 Tax=Actinophytocola sp. TaxID=1872138 RepID=UPI003D6C4EF0
MRRLFTALVALAAVTAPAAPAYADAGCRDTMVPLTVEEQRLTRVLGDDPEPVAAQLLRRSGFDRNVAQFERALCAAGSATAARGVVTGHGRRLWELAVARARDGAPHYASLPGGDDRPLYWARLAMTAALRQWAPGFPVDRPELEKRLEYASRGITSSDFGGAPGVRQLFVSGFDPFLLDQEIRRGNPSGAGVLPLDGQVIEVAGVRVEIEVAVFPVRYADFDHGIVEDGFAPHYAAGRQRADLVSTVSQGRPDAFDIEKWNGRRRSTSSVGDNNDIWGGGTSTAPVVFPGVGPGPEFIGSSLPLEAMAAPTGQPFLARVNSSVVEIPAGSTTPVFRPDGPTEGSIAVQGGGGGYLSNEIAYRNTLLRDAYGLATPAGHVHTPVLVMDPNNTTEITDPTFERNRADITAQLLLILRAGAATLG